MEERWEAMCLNCGACCGSLDDPCRHLCRNAEGRSFCDTYENRLGPKLTVGGRVFNCVRIHDLLEKSWVGDSKCPYKQLFNQGII